MLAELIQQKQSIFKILDHIDKNNLSKKYDIIVSKNPDDYHELSMSTKKISQFYEKSKGNIDIFLELLKLDDNQFSSMIYLKKKKQINEIPKLLRDVGYIIVPQENDFINRIYVPRRQLEKKMKIVLSKKIKNNILLVGEPGTGKTTLVEYYARNHKSQKILCIEVAKMIGGSQYRGEFEQKVVDILNYAVKEDLIIFFDELHSLIDLGHSTGGMSATNILKPYLSGQKLKFIGATTIKEANILLEDEAFKRRFSIIKVPEFELSQLLKLKGKFLGDFNIPSISNKDFQMILDNLKNQLPNQHFPDKLIDFLDYYSATTRVLHTEVSIENTLKDYIYECSSVY
ncbi:MULTISPECIES: AAA family ATPase [Bacillus]|uniref:AAA family ATPase n=1 Tax=Bacillus TaxID=1386 RepID=UPI0001CE34B6|nr:MULTISPECIES: AAA family ATPase [Bacillus]AMK74589.1 hypothetical protein AWV81_21875 [Bacillus subtilis subsp. natto]API96590.1 hypothetical protein BKP58_12450 [Bacillus subtilis]ARI86711.1 hypothetical protein B7470_11510 [Bacillus subtilis]ASB72260.1 Chaperone protein ClpB [Bacillus subtilis subsp. subtilis]MBG9562245.1 hypothetical protein [Bacillus subtilis]